MYVCFINILSNYLLFIVIKFISQTEPVLMFEDIKTSKVLSHLEYNSSMISNIYGSKVSQFGIFSFLTIWIECNYV